jgi:hypothetical protein
MDPRPLVGIAAQAADARGRVNTMNLSFSQQFFRPAPEHLLVSASRSWSISIKKVENKAEVETALSCVPVMQDLHLFN